MPSVSIVINAANGREHRIRQYQRDWRKDKNSALKEFKSVKRIKEASFEEISAVIGEAKAKTVKEGLDNEQQ